MAADFTTPEGYRSYKRSIVYLLGAAGASIDVGVTVEESVGASFVFKVGVLNSTLADSATRLLTAMRQLIAKNINIERQSIAREELLDYFHSTGSEHSHAYVSALPLSHIDCNVLQLHDSGKRYFAVAHFGLVPSTGLIQSEHFDITVENSPVAHLRLHHAAIGAGGLYLAPASDRRDESILLQAYAVRKEWGKKLELNSVPKLNKRVTDSKIKQLVQYSEGIHDHQIVSITNRIAGIGGGPSAVAPRLVLIAGPSSSGKTTFAKRLSVSLETVGLHPIVISVDSYYKGWPDIDSRGMKFVDWESLHSLHLELLNEHLVDLLAGKEVLVPEYDMKTSMPMSTDHWVKTKLPAGGLIIMEGIHCLNPELTSRIPRSEKFQIMISPLSSIIIDDLTIQSSSQVRMLRRMVRDYLFRGRSAEGTLAQWPAVALGERHNIYPNQIYADVVMNSGLPYEVGVLKVFAEPLLKTIMPHQPEYNEARRLLRMLDGVMSLSTELIPPQSLLREFVGGSWFYEFGGLYKTA